MTLTEDNVADYAETLVLQVRGGGRTLDYSEASLAIVEELLRVSDELFQLESFPEMQRNMVTFYNGCYVGEVIARNLHGVWSFTENWFDSSLVCSHVNGSGVQVHPFHKLYRRISEGPSENDIVYYFEGLKAKFLELS